VTKYLSSPTWRRVTPLFIIHKLNDGTSAASFNYWIAAKRKGYKTYYLEEMVGEEPE
jgi:hypothetical protein